MTFETLFRNCAYGKYEECGDHVNYLFKADGRTLYIYFQGSRGDVDWRRNFSFWKKPYKDMKKVYRVHAGFAKAWKEVADIVIAKITEKAADGTYKWDKIITVGYSHGGALAAFCQECVWYHREDIRDNCWGIGFEAPRIFAGFLFRKELRARWKNFRVIRNQQDIVTHVPPFLFGFKHVGEIVKIGGRPHLLAALWNCFKALLNKDKSAAKQHALEFVQVTPHYSSKVIASLQEFDASEEGRSLATEIGIN